MQRRACQRQEEHRQQLRVDAAADVRRRHAHLLHDGKPGLILIALAQLLIVDDQHRRADEQHAEDDADEEQAAVGAVKLVGGLCPKRCGISPCGFRIVQRAADGPAQCQLPFPGQSGVKGSAPLSAVLPLLQRSLLPDGHAVGRSRLIERLFQIRHGGGIAD